jgi:hypothetical protein
LKLTPFKLLSILNPVSLLELSVHDKLMSKHPTAVAARLDGARGVGSGVAVGVGVAVAVGVGVGVAVGVALGLGVGVDVGVGVGVVQNGVVFALAMFE